MFVMSLSVVFVVYDASVPGPDPGTGSPGSVPGAGVDPATVAGQVACVVAVASVLLVVVIKWKEKKIKGKNRDAFQHLMKSRR